MHLCKVISPCVKLWVDILSRGQWFQLRRAGCVQPVCLEVCPFLQRGLKWHDCTWKLTNWHLQPWCWIWLHISHRIPQTTGCCTSSAVHATQGVNSKYCSTKGKITAAASTRSHHIHCSLTSCYETHRQGLKTYFKRRQTCAGWRSAVTTPGNP